MFRAVEQPGLLQFADDGRFPNSSLPVLVYCSVLTAPADEVEEQLRGRGWSNCWRGGVYSFHHYHSLSHEVLAVLSGQARLRLGGPRLGRVVEVRAGDVLVLPAGVAHQRQQSSSDFLVMGAYPEGRNWDLLRGQPDERPAADRRIRSLPCPAQDPVWGPAGPLTSLWSAAAVDQRTLPAPPR